MKGGINVDYAMCTVALILGKGGSSLAQKLVKFLTISTEKLLGFYLEEGSKCIRQTPLQRLLLHVSRNPLRHS